MNVNYINVNYINIIYINVINVILRKYIKSRKFSFWVMVWEGDSDGGGRTTDVHTVKDSPRVKCDKPCLF